MEKGKLIDPFITEQFLLLERNASNASINVNYGVSHKRSGNLGHKTAPIARLL